MNNKLWFYLDAVTMPCKGALIFAKSPGNSSHGLAGDRSSSLGLCSKPSQPRTALVKWFRRLDSIPAQRADRKSLGGVVNSLPTDHPGHHLIAQGWIHSFVALILRLPLRLEYVCRREAFSHSFSQSGISCAAVTSDKLDGKITEEFWQRKQSEWQAEEVSITTQIQGLKETNFEECLVDTHRIVKLAQNAHSLYLTRKPSEQADLLRMCF